MRSTVVLFQSHFFDRWAEAAFRRLSAHAPPNFEHAVLLHLPAGAPVPERVKRYAHHIVRTPELRQLPYPAKAGAPDWDLWSGGHTDLIAMHYWRAHPGHDRYWMIEYDVRFSGPWRRFFAMFEDDDSDLLAPMLRRRRHSPDWLNWPLLTSPDGPLDDMESREQLHADLPHLGPAHAGDGRGVPAGLGRAHGIAPSARSPRCAACASRIWADTASSRPTPTAAGSTAVRRATLYHTPGTLVFKPTFFRTGSRPDMLWHPVKPFWPAQELRRELRAFAQGDRTRCCGRGPLGSCRPLARAGLLHRAALHAHILNERHAGLRSLLATARRLA